MPRIYRRFSNNPKKSSAAAIGIGAGAVVGLGAIAYLLYKSTSQSVTPPGGGGGGPGTGLACSNNGDCSSLGPDWACNNGYCYEVFPSGFVGGTSNNGGKNSLIPGLLINATSTSGNITFTSSSDTITITTVDNSGNPAPAEVMWFYSETEGMFNVSLPSSGGSPKTFYSNSSGSIPISVSIPVTSNPSPEWYQTWMQTVDHYTGPQNVQFNVGQFYFGSIGLSLVGTDVQAELQVYVNVNAIV